ncbi:TPA: MerR family transcriptional regulator [Bacillus anthracis]|nr:MerR family transcriptional regulator [Bacillus anthracis]
MDNKDYIKDVDFEEISENNSKEKSIRGKALYYSTNQVATMLDEKDSKIRYYTKFFDDILKIEVSNTQRQYTEEDIEKLRFIIDLKNEGMTLKQIKEYCQEVDFHNGEISVKESNPLAIQTLAKALMEEQTKQIENLKTELFEQLKEFIVSQNIEQSKVLENIKEEIAVTVDEVVGEKMQTSLSEIKETFKVSYVTKEEIESLKRKKSWFGWLKK